MAWLNGCVLYLYECVICDCLSLARTFTERAQCVPILTDISGQRCGSESLANVVSHQVLKGEGGLVGIRVLEIVADYPSF